MSSSHHLPDKASGAELAIIVPAYKAEFLREALESIAAQTSRDFNLYVFDDGGPAAVEAIVNGLKFASAGLNAPHWQYGPFVGPAINWILSRI